MSDESPDDPRNAVPALIDEKDLRGSIIRLAWPVVVQQASFAMVQLVDTALVGHLGEDALAGVRLAGLLLWFSMSGMIAIGVGATAVVARIVGSGESRDASKVMQTVLMLAVAWGLLMMVLMLLFGGWLLGLLGAEPAAQAEGTKYLNGLAFGLPFFSFVFAGNAAQQGAGDTRSPMVVGLLINVVNAFASFVLINGSGPFPELAVLGSGLGFTIAGIVGALLVAGVLMSGRRSLSWIPFRRGVFNSADAGRILNVGVPAGLEQAQFNVAFMIYTRIIASLGTTALAAHGVTLAMQTLTFNIGFALSIATSAIVGQTLGAQRPDLAEKASYMTMRYSLVFMCVVAVILMTLGGQITSIFVGGANADAVVDIARQTMFIFAFALPGLAISLSLSGSLRGAGDTRAVLYIMAGCTWIVRLIPAYLLAITFGLGVPGAWLAAIADINVRAVIMFLRFRRGKWKHMKV
ncbi:MAG: MATE family efflux transporter [Chloroflexi bacterium]|nr:MATE family efflux transporter [Chloroflexota bacterium]